MSVGHGGYSDHGTYIAITVWALQIKTRGEFLGSVYLTDNYSIF
jgi:hypothetical protein